MVDWLTGNVELFGLTAQNWMLLTGGALAIYIVTLMLTRHRQGAR